MRGHALFVASLLLFPLLACKGITRGKENAGATASAKASAAAVSTAPVPVGSVALPPAPNGILPPGAADGVLKRGERAVVHLIDAGAPPRAPLRYQLVAGSLYTVDFALELGKVAGMAMPKLALVYDYAVGAPDAQGPGW